MLVISCLCSDDWLTTEGENGMARPLNHNFLFKIFYGMFIMYLQFKMQKKQRKLDTISRTQLNLQFFDMVFWEHMCRAICSVIGTQEAVDIKTSSKQYQTVQHKALLLERQACALPWMDFFSCYFNILFCPSSRGDWWPWLQSTMWYMEYRCNNVYSVSFQSFVNCHDSICVFIYMCVSQEKNWHKYQRFNQFTNIFCFLLWDVLERVCGIRPLVTFVVRCL